MVAARHVPHLERQSEAADGDVPGVSETAANMRGSAQNSRRRRASLHPEVEGAEDAGAGPSTLA